MNADTKKAENPVNDSKYLILQDPVLRWLYGKAEEDRRILDMMEWVDEHFDGFVKKIEKRLDTSMSEADQKNADEEINTMLMQSFDDIALSYRGIAEVVAQRQIYGMFEAKLAKPANELILSHIDHIDTAINHKLTKLKMEYSQIIGGLIEQVKSYDTTDSNGMPKHTKRIGRIYLSLRKIRTREMHELCDEEYRMAGSELKSGKVVDKMNLKLAREILKTEDYAQLETHIEYYKRSLNGEFTGDCTKMIKDAEVKKKLDRLANETRLFGVLVSYTIVNSINPQMAMNAIKTNGIDAVEFLSALSVYDPTIVGSVPMPKAPKKTDNSMYA